MPLQFCLWDSPVGELKLVADELSLVAVLWPNDPAGRVRLDVMEPSERHPVLNEARRQLQQYFALRRQRFDIPLSPRGTPFQLSVWKGLQAIPYGEHCSYGELAKRIGNGKAARAVGAANGKNPISIIVPCHRVIGSGGSLTGFAGGIDTKRTLLELESEFKARAGKSN